MKRIIFTIVITLLIIAKANSQSDIPKKISDEFAYSVNYNYKYGNGNTRLYILEMLRRKGYKPMDADVLVESIADNSKNRNLILEVFHNLSGGDKEFLYANLYSLGISATSSKYLAEFIIAKKYILNKPKTKNETEMNSKNNDVLLQISNSVISQEETKKKSESLKRRKILINPKPEYNCNEQGAVVLQITVNRQGNVIEAKYTKGTTNTAKCLIDSCIEVAFKTKYEADENATEKQIEYLTYNFRFATE